jgi:hypothetical protein
MRIGWQKFLIASVLFGVGIVSACSVEVISGPTGAGGTGGSAGTGGGGGAKADGSPDGAFPDAPAADTTSSDSAAGDASSDATTADTIADNAGDTVGPDVSRPSDATDAADAGLPDLAADGATTDGQLADSLPDAGGACFAEDPSDAGSMNDCTSLPYYGRQCRDDAGLDWPPAGATLCDTLNTDLKATAFLELIACLSALPGADGGVDACSGAHEQGAADCSRAIFNRSMCPVPDSAVEGGLYGCAQIAASCGPDSGAGGIPVELCQAWLGPFNATARKGIIDCYLDPADVGATSCRDKFENFCVFP